MIDKNDTIQRTQYLANSVPSTSIWLRILPNNPLFKFNRQEYRFNLLQHFALDKDIDSLLELPLQPIACACNRMCFRAPDDSTPRATYNHLVSCTQASAFITRHNQLINICADAVRSVGLTPQLETQASRLPTATVHQHQIQQKLRFDITASGISNTNTLQCDVSVTSHRQRDRRLKEGGANFALHAADDACKTKINKYQHAIYPDSETIVPLVAETSGAIHLGVIKFFEALGTRVDNKPPLEATWTTPSFSSYWLAAFSATLRRESARSLQRLARKALALSGRQGPIPSGFQPGGFDQ
jgi:hypothetical protein